MRIATWFSLVLLGCGGPDTDDVGDTPEDSDVDSTDTTEETDGDTPADTVEETDTVETETEDTTPPADPCMVEPSVVMGGLGEYEFSTVTAGALTPSTHGAQGGWHYWGAVSVQNAPQRVRLQFQVVDVATGNLLHDSPTNAVLVPPAPGAWACEGTYVGILGVLDGSSLFPDPTCDDDQPYPQGVEDPTPCPPVPELLCGRDLELRYTVLTSTGILVGEDSVVIRYQTDPGFPDRPCP